MPQISEELSASLFLSFCVSLRAARARALSDSSKTHSRQSQGDRIYEAYEVCDARDPLRRQPHSTAHIPTLPYSEPEHAKPARSPSHLRATLP